MQDCLNLQKIVHLYKSVQVCVYLCKSAQVHTNLHEFVEICMGLCESEQVCVNLNKFVQKLVIFGLVCYAMI